MLPPVELVCPRHRARLTPDTGANAIDARTRVLHCALGCSFPVVEEIPRFVTSDNYAASFGHQWNIYRKTQLDSCTGTSISRERLQRCLGGSYEVIRGKTVLEAGCGAGRFTEILLREGAKVFACDLSQAVDANWENCGGAQEYFVCQANLLTLPVKPASFDVVLCLGVIQHTPDPDATIARLSSYVKPGGLLVLDHYRSDAADMTVTQQRVRRWLLTQSPAVAHGLTRSLVALLWPVHRLLWVTRTLPYGSQVRQHWLQFSPVLDYHDAYAELGPRLLRAWAALDTHDALTDRYKFKRTVEQIATRLQALGLTDIEAYYGGNGVEARGRMPANVSRPGET